MSIRRKVLLSLLWCIALGPVPAYAEMVTVEITNTTHDIYFTPLLVSAHPSTSHVFQPGAEASADLQAMAEGGDIAGLLADLGGEDADTVANPAGGLLGPGETATAVLDTTATGNTQLSVVAMLLPTNDGFVGLDALEIPTQPGIYTYSLNGYDAGTEANDELLNPIDGGVPGVAGIPGDPGGGAGTGGSGVAGADSNTTVHVHRGVLGDADPAGGRSDLDSSRHRWLNPVAQLGVTVQ
jgi:hypothetical protein